MRILLILLAGLMVGCLEIPPQPEIVVENVTRCRWVNKDFYSYRRDKRVERRVRECRICSRDRCYWQTRSR